MTTRRNFLSTITAGAAALPVAGVASGRASAAQPMGANDRRLMELEQRYYEAKAATNALPPDADFTAAQQREWACMDGMAAIQPDGPAGYAAIARTLAANRRDLDFSISEQATSHVESALIERCLSYLASGGPA